MRNWQMQQAKARFSELITKVETEGPQEITKRGKPVVIIISFDDFEKLQAKPKPSFVEFMRNSPLVGVKLDLKRDKSLWRDEEEIGL
jgi:antitoxin Phd